jgi:hypothetical protein
VQELEGCYKRDVEHGSSGPKLACKPYLETAEAWMYIKAHGLQKSLPAVCIGQYACNTVLIEPAACRLYPESHGHITTCGRVGTA